MPRRQGDSPEAIEFSALEREVLGEMKAMTGCTSIANLIRTALWRFSEHLDMQIDLRAGVFDERHAIRTGRNQFSGRHKTPKRRDVPKPKGRKQPADHPWAPPASKVSA